MPSVFGEKTMKTTLKLSVLILLILFVISPLIIAKTRGASSIGSIDINNQETGDGGDCFFFITENDVESYIFVDRDGYGWMNVNNKIEKLKPIKEFIMWPSKEGDKLNRIYKSGQLQVKLSVEVIVGCKEYEDSCAVVYDGTLNLHLKDNETIIKIKGNCSC
jgi:hypothetical protein